MKAALIANFQKGNARASTGKITEILKRNNCKIVFSEYDYTGEYRNVDLDGCDFFLAVGGDGTIIHTAKTAAEHGKPILGVNAGTLGFTAALESGELSLLDRVFTGDYEIDQRLMLEAQVSCGTEKKTLVALNDIVISAEQSKIIDYTLSVNCNRPYSYRADGLIVATPTGSTAYSLSAGGPVTEPSLGCLIYTPICPHSLFNRSVIFSADSKIEVTITSGEDIQVSLTADGEIPLSLHAGNTVTFSRAARAADFICLNKKNFYDTLNRKMIGIDRD